MSVANILREAYCTRSSFANFTTHSYFSSMFLYQQFYEIQSQSEALGIGFRSICLPKSLPNMFEVARGDSLSGIFYREFIGIQTDVYRSSCWCKFVRILQNIFYNDVPTFFVCLFRNVFVYMSSECDMFFLINFLDIVYNRLRIYGDIYLFFF